MANLPRLRSIATAVPPYPLDQGAVVERVKRLFADFPDLDRLLPLFAHTGIERRYSCVPIDWYDAPHGWPERNRIYREAAVDLLETATRAALDRAGLAPQNIDSIVVVSTTGIATPSLDALLIERMRLRPDVRRLPIFGLGCAGGAIGLARAATMAAAAPGSVVLFLVIELCGLWFRRDDLEKSNIVATSLFGDGAAAIVLGCDGDGPAIVGAGEHTWPGSLDVMGWDIADDGLRAIFSRDIPRLVTTEMRPAAVAFLAGIGWDLAAVGRFICHPGGAKVVVALEQAFGLQPGALTEARRVLRDYGNMSAATVIFVLERVLAAGATGTMLLTALGPGFTAGFVALDGR